VETYCDSEKDNAFDKKKITADSKPKADIDADTKVKLKQIVSLWMTVKD
jgi:type I restriction enzyme M protein